MNKRLRSYGQVFKAWDAKGRPCFACGSPCGDFIYPLWNSETETWDFECRQCHYKFLNYWNESVAGRIGNEPKTNRGCLC